MKNEIEHRFLLRTENFSFLDGMPRMRFEQGYFPTQPGISLRVRIIDDAKAFITHKRGEGVVREETEVPIGVAEGRELLDCCAYRFIKTRYKIGAFEIDFFEGPLQGIVLAEIELASLEEGFEKPTWLKDAIDVTESVNNLALAKLASRLGGKTASTPLSEMLRPPLPLIVLTGGPCSGKTTAIARLKKELGDKIRVVPEAARFLIEELGLRPDPSNEVAYARFQSTLYTTQRSLEEAALDDAWSQGQKAVIADRGTLDTLAYLDGGEKQFEHLTGARVSHELERYTRVIHLATAPRSHFKNDAARKESYEEACRLGDLVEVAWKGHRDLRRAKLYQWDHKIEQVIEYVLGAIPD